MSSRPAINNNQDTQSSADGGFGGSFILRASNKWFQFCLCFHIIKKGSKHVPMALWVQSLWEKESHGTFHQQAYLCHIDNNVSTPFELDLDMCIPLWMQSWRVVGRTDESTKHALMQTAHVPAGCLFKPLEGK